MNKFDTICESVLIEAKNKPLINIRVNGRRPKPNILHKNLFTKITNALIEKFPDKIRSGKWEGGNHQEGGNGTLYLFTDQYQEEYIMFYWARNIGPYKDDKPSMKIGLKSGSTVKELDKLINFDPKKDFNKILRNVNL